MMPVMRSVKNIVNNYTDAEVRVREATSNDPWGPSSTLMAEIADLTYNVVAFTEIMQMIWKRLNDHGKNWRHVYKALTLLEYIIKTGSEKVSQQCKENVFAIQTLKDFQYSEEGKDHGVNVREKAKALVSLLKDDDRLKNERAKALKAKERLSQSAFGIGSEGAQTQFGAKPGKFSPSGMRASESFGSSSPELSQPTSSRRGAPAATELEEARPSSAGEEELQLQLALAMSKEEAEAEEKKRRNDDLKLQMALEESRKELPAPAITAAPGSMSPPHLRTLGGSSAEGGMGVERLLDFDLPAAPKAVNDPWLSGSGAQPPSDPFAPASATFSAVPPVVAVTTSDPWGAPTPVVAASSAPPALASRQAQAATFDPWSGSSSRSVAASAPPPAPAAVPAKDPWAAPSATLPPAKTSSSPWDTPHSNGSASAVPADDFEFVIMRSAPAATVAGQSNGNGGTAFDLSSMGQSLPSSTNNIKPKNAEDFLGPNSKLVNLDRLVTKAPSAAPANPFASGGVQPSVAMGFGATTQNNPFAGQQQSTRPSLNQMSTSTSGSFAPLAPVLPNPMMPGMTTYGAYEARPYPQASLNPFL